MQDYNTIIGAIQMRLNKCPTRSVMDRFRIGSSTLNLIMSRYKALELTIDELEAMSPKKVENLFYPQKNLQRKEVPLPDFQYYYDRIHAPNSRVNISFCWLDYKEKNPDGVYDLSNCPIPDYPNCLETAQSCVHNSSFWGCKKTPLTEKSPRP